MEKIKWWKTKDIDPETGSQFLMAIAEPIVKTSPLYKKFPDQFKFDQPSFEIDTGKMKFEFVRCTTEEEEKENKDYEKLVNSCGY